MQTIYDLGVLIFLFYIAVLPFALGGLLIYVIASWWFRRRRWAKLDQKYARPPLVQAAPRTMSIGKANVKIVKQPDGTWKWEKIRGIE